jgi:CheY-like chemotaxis protein
MTLVHPVVLLVQPERDDRAMYVEFLRHAGMRPVPVSTAAAALQVAAGVDVIVTGMLLPGAIDGVALVAHLKSNQQTKRIPVIALTTCAWDTERERALRAGCDVFLSKPCLPHLLAREIRRLLGHRIRKSSFAPPAA